MPKWLKLTIHRTGCQTLDISILTINEYNRTVISGCSMIKVRHRYSFLCFKTLNNCNMATLVCNSILDIRSK